MIIINNMRWSKLVKQKELIKTNSSMCWTVIFHQISHIYKWTLKKKLINHLLSLFTLDATDLLDDSVVVFSSFSLIGILITWPTNNVRDKSLLIRHNSEGVRSNRAATLLNESPSCTYEKMLNKIRY